MIFQNPWTKSAIYHTYMVKNGIQARIAAFRLPSTLLGNINLPDSCDYVHIEGQRVYFVKDDYIAAFEFTEE
ncbi:hypothetical protein MASR2M29_19660 [Spirochaetota bacterium]